MKEVNVHAAKTHFSKLLHQVMAGEEIIIAKSGVPVAKLVPIQTKSEKRVAGSAKGKVTLSGEFFEELPAALLDAFETK